jgi:TPR repeat protein
MNNLGNMLNDTGDSEGAVRLWQRAVDAGSEAAMYNLGRARYLAGDHSTAEQWWQRAADAGSAEAVMGLAALAEGENPLPVKPNGEISTASEGVNVQANIEVVNQTLRFTPITDQDSLGPDVSADALLGTSFWWENQNWTITAASLLENGHHVEITIEPADARVPTDRAPLT